MTFVIQIDHFEPQSLADELVEVADRLTPDLRSRHEAAHAEIDEYAALDDLRHRRLDHFVVLVRFDDFLPRLERARAPLGEKERAVVVVDAMDHHFQRIADFQIFGLYGQREFAERQRAFGFAADIYQQFILILRDDQSVEDLSLVQDFE